MPLRGRVALQCFALGTLSAVAELASAAHPFITDDTKTQGKGRFELELGTQYTRASVDDVTLANFQFAPQLTYGTNDSLDLILRPTYDINVASGGASGRAAGFGDTNLEFKWRFWQQEQRDRKSTRLNSSHTVISYAVFCLKKKSINRVGAASVFGCRRLRCAW